MTWWLDLRHPEDTSPIHPNGFEKREGARLYFDDRKAALARREMKQGDSVFIYECATNPSNVAWSGPSAVGALVLVDSPPYERVDRHRNARTGNAENWKVDASWVIALRDWRRGVPLDRLRSILGYRRRWSPRSLMRLPEAAAKELLAALEAFDGQVALPAADFPERFLRARPEENVMKRLN